MTCRWISFDFCVVQCDKEEELAEQEELWESMEVETIVSVSFFDSIKMRRLFPNRKIRLYSFPLASFPDLCDWERKQLLFLLSYESSCGRKLAFRFESPESESAFLETVMDSKKYAEIDPPERLPSCTLCKAGGCRTDLLCYSAPFVEAIDIFTSGEIYSEAKRKSLTASELSGREDNVQGYPPDYYQYVNFFWGNCGKNKDGEDYDAFLLPDIRFYFRYADLEKLEQAAFDGYHPLKIKDSFLFSSHCEVCVIPQEYAESFRSKMSDEWRSRIVYIDSKESITYQDWTKHAYEAAKSRLLEDGHELFRRENQ